MRQIFFIVEFVHDIGYQREKNDAQHRQREVTRKMESKQNRNVNGTNQ